MFKIGDKIFYPMHGAGIVEAIEEKEILGKTQLYYILNMNLTNMQVMIPAEKADHSLIREVVDSSVLEEALSLLNLGEQGSTVDTQYKRQRVHMEKMKSGDINEEIKVIRDLMSLSKNKKLGMGDKVMLDNARLMLISELSLVMGLDREEATDLLNQRNHFNKA